MSLRSQFVFHARLTAFVLLVESFTFWGWSRWIWTPVQAHYMSAYLWNSLPERTPESKLRVRWIWKTAPGGKRELAVEDDAVRVPSNEHDRTGMDLSQTAREAGWTGLFEGPSESVPTSGLLPILTRQIFEGQSVWLFVLLPGMVGFVITMLLLQCFVWLDDWLPEMPWRRQRFPWEEPVPTVFDRFAIWVKSTPSRVASLREQAIQKPATQVSRSTIAPVKRASENPKSDPVFGIQGGTSPRVYMWCEKDEID